jgi:hypothetical protein
MAGETKREKTASGAQNSPFSQVVPPAAWHLTIENETPSSAIAEHVLNIVISVLTKEIKFCLAP